mgnify:CR=1 FL=1
MADVRLFRLTTGEDIIGNIKEGDEESNTITLEKPYVIIPQQEAPGKPVTLGFHQYIPYGKCDEVIFKNQLVPIETYLFQYNYNIPLNCHYLSYHL